MGQESPPGIGTAALRGRRTVWGTCLFILVAIAVSAFVSLKPLTSGISNIRHVQGDAAATQAVAELRTSLSDFQLLLEPGFTVQMSAAETTSNLAKAAQLVQTITVQTTALEKALPLADGRNVVTTLRAASNAFTKACTGLTPLASGMPIGKGGVLIAAERGAFATMWSATAAVATRLTDATASGLAASDRDFDVARETLFVVLGVAAATALAVALVVGQRAHRRQRAERTAAARRSFGAALQEALEMSNAESAVYSVVAKAFQQWLPDLQVEMLVADSSRAHLHQTVSTGNAENHHGCGVVSPRDCPATVRGHTLTFPTSSALNACPYLRDEVAGASSAVCIPISVAGKTVGVTHAAGTDGIPPTQADIGYLEITSRRASERIAMVRAFEKSERQAKSDPLTGLWNRRSLENRVRELQHEGVSYALAYGDLDNFKNLNDTHGHEAGDQALRLFSRVLRDSMRPNDVAARYGGEEFVIVLPDCGIQGARVVLERVRERLALALSTGRVPPFTVSFGLASSSDAETFDEVVAVADHALLTAKAAGRNRVVVALETSAGEMPTTETAPSPSATTASSLP